MVDDLENSSRGATLVRVQQDHDGVTLQIGHSKWIRVVIAVGAAASALPSAAFIATFGIATFASPVVMCAVVPPLFVGMVMAASALWTEAFSNRVMALFALPMVLFGAYALALLSILTGVSAFVPFLVVVGLAQLLGAAWILYNAIWFPHDRQISVTSAQVKIQSGERREIIPLESVLGTTVAGRGLTLELSEGPREIGAGLPASTLSGLAERISVAAEKRRLAMTEERPPPEALHQLVGAARRQVES